VNRLRSAALLGVLLLPWDASAAIKAGTAAYAGNVTATSQTYSFNMPTGSGGFLAACVWADLSSDLIMGVDYDEQAMSLVGKQLVSGARYHYLFALANPHTGTNTLTVRASASSFIQTVIASYTGVRTSGQPEVMTEAQTSGTLTTTLSTLSDGAWAVDCVGGSSGLNSFSHFTQRATDTDFNTLTIGDHGPIAYAGSVSMTANGGTTSSLMMALAPAVRSGSGLALMGVGGGRNFGLRVPIYTTDTAQTVIDAHAAGTTYLIKAGYHRMQSINPKDGDTYLGESGAILSGSKVLSSGLFVTASGFWKITGQTQSPLSRFGTCASGYSGCDFPEELFVDGNRQIHVETLGELASGKWYFNYGTDEIYVGDNPSGHTIETSVTATAFNPTADFVTIDNLIIQEYASAVQYGAVYAEGTRGWTIKNSTIALNHGGAIRLGDNLRLIDSRIAYNGEIGVVGIGDGVLLDNVEIDHNNGAHFDYGWEGGGTKFVQTDGLVVRNSYVHDNEGPGLWTDIDNVNAVIEDNQVADNFGVGGSTASTAGIFHEISWAAIIRRNTVTGNGFPYDTYGWGAGILVASSRDVEVYGNTVSGNGDGIVGIQQNRGSGTFGAHEIENLWVHDNIVTMDQGWSGLLHSEGGDVTYYDGTRNNAFDNNTYDLTGDDHFAWNDLGDLPFATWQGTYSQDTGGSAAIH
jgi:hypothetical protein